MRTGPHRVALLREVLGMAFETLRTNKLRSGLTVLGVVIGITAIVGMTSLIRGFDESLRTSIRQFGPTTIYIAKFSAVSLTAGRDFASLARRPDITVEDADAIERLAPSVGVVDIWLASQGGVRERVFFSGDRTREVAVVGATEQFATVNFVDVITGRFFSRSEVDRRRRVVVLGDTPYQALFAPSGIDPIGKTVRVGAIEYTVVGVLEPRPSLGGFDTRQDEFVVIPQTTHQLVFDTRARSGFRGGSAMVAVVPRADATLEQTLLEVEQIMRARHRLTLDEPNDFDLVTQDAILRVWEQISQATLLGLIVISSIALMVGGVGVMAVMTMSVTERTREIGVRKALGARRRDILLQFLAEAAALTLVGGLIGVLVGSGIGLAISAATGFPVSLPWWSFALGLTFSAGVGIFFGMLPAVRASRLDPIDALRYE